ncbi:MAG: PilZ domain-containing protein [Myxococcales bacterium]|nr:PilZ domain-containing protein [Myxococcales bacterium]
MSDPITTSRSAREALSKGLNALQTDPSIPPHLLELAAPIAQAMGALHQLEKTQQLAPHADVALQHVRAALASLQQQAPTHAAVNNALESVAASLGMVHSLSKMANGPAAQPPPAQAAPAPSPPAAQPQPAPQMAPQQMAPQQPPPQQAQVHMPPQQQVPTTTAAMQRPAQPGPGPGATMAIAPNAAPMVARDPFAAPPGPSPMAGTQAAPAAPYGPPAGAPPQPGFPAHPGGPPPGAPPPGFSPGGPPPGGPPPGHGGPPPGHGAPMGGPPPGQAPAPGGVIGADLGAHSPTNFYKGLAGNDIIDHGGLFVSTYMTPKVGTQVRLKVSLPGGYEFEANAIVRWTRDDSGDAPPGFGAQFTDITQDARQLVYRYVRNREPIFYDDL